VTLTGFPLPSTSADQVQLDHHLDDGEGAQHSRRLITVVTSPATNDRVSSVGLFLQQTPDDIVSSRGIMTGIVKPCTIPEYPTL